MTNGRVPGARKGEPSLDDDASPDDEALDDDAPLDDDEAAAGAAEAGAAADETLDERVAAVLLGFPDLTRTQDGAAHLLAVGGRVFAVLSPELLEVALDPAVARAALATPDTRPSPRGAGWVAFSPSAIDRFALDRGEAWVRLAHRRAGDRPT